MYLVGAYRVSEPSSQGTGTVRTPNEFTREIAASHDLSGLQHAEN